MTHAAPNPGGFDPFFRLRKEEQVAESRRGAGEPNPGEHDEPVEAGAGEELVAEGPFSLDRLRAHQDARAAGDGEALREVATDLAQLLDLTRDHIKETGKGVSRQRVRAAFPKYRSALELPFGEAAEFLGLAPDRVGDVQRALARDGGVAPAHRHQALKDVDSLRARLHQAVAAGDHAALDELLDSVSRLAVLEVTGGPVVRDVVRAGFAALAMFALRDPEPPRAGEVWHRRLVASSTQPEGHARRVLPAVRSCAARVVTLRLDWPEKEQYWALLAQDTPDPARLAAFAPPFSGSAR
ncbi:hypothetical protein FHX82_005559 [Amycolatopsis bartoniae]|uniref:Uncharacterized protein n=1 Tax=Amycolatopsis bartoniae TaxID=941986 RepID=A0A8H9MCA6_9PSEU|nr:hypothetical protein [Amycolatopsis bartoniae]MBB2938481.1 hypothetical protein [Amycolatopsis bartoniae]TVT10370.1 hypothetical protein FNH07_05640 [Amycolatopsis bartoniae]GHF70709.1 hypothetical protein GCM10017566_50640 [Amycolatopsis bartoniae]